MKVVILGNYPTYPFSKELDVPILGRKVTTWLIYFSKYLAADKNTEVHVVAEDELIKHDKYFFHENIHFHFLKCPSKFKAATFFFGDVLRINRKLNEIKPDIINAHHTDEYALAAVFSKYPYVITVHGILSRFVPKNKLISRERIVSYVEKYVLKRAKNLIASSPFVYGAVSHLTKAKFYDVENVIDEDYFNATKDYSVNHNLTYIGYLIKDKGIHFLLEAVKILKNEYPNMRLNLIGNPSPYQMEYFISLKNYTRLHELEKNVVFCGFLTDIEKIKILEKTTALTHPSRLETFCMSIAEAMATGTPVIASNVGGVPYTIGNNNNALLFPYGSIDDLADKIRLLFNNQSMRIEIGKRAKSEAQNRFHPTIVIPKLISCFQDILENINCRCN